MFLVDARAMAWAAESVRPLAQSPVGGGAARRASRVLESDVVLHIGGSAVRPYRSSSRPLLRRGGGTRSTTAIPYRVRLNLGDVS